MAKIINYVIAHPWDDKEPDNLCIYTYFSDVHRDTKEGAKYLLKDINNRNDKVYSIYKVKFKKLKD